LRETFPDTREDLVEILESLLQFNPYMRPTAKELMKHSIFNDIRIQKNELKAQHKINIDIDN